jgi:predicted RNase H-like nuclease
VLRGTLQRAGDGTRIGPRKDPAIEIERVARLRHVLRPSLLFSGHRTVAVHRPSQPVYDSIMTTIAGMDGCPAGWMCIFQKPPSLRVGSKVFNTIGEVFAAAPELGALAIDIPIGLTEAGPRACDVEARRRLGPVRAASVFAAPIRPALHAENYAEACDAAFRAQGKKLSKQSWAIYPKIRQVDELLSRRPELRERVYEVHPEVTFAEWNGLAIVEPKRKRAGFARRHELVSAHFGADAYTTIRDRYTRKDVADDDILDAFAALWTAERILRGIARSLPEKPPVDARGLAMRIVC